MHHPPRYVRAGSFHRRLATIVLIWLATLPTIAMADIVADAWVTTQDLTKNLNRERQLRFTPSPPGAASDPAVAGSIRVDAGKTYQTMLGLGSSLEHSTCFNLSRLSEHDRQQVITRLVDRREGIGMNLMRICMGTPDFTGEPWYSYDDMPAGQADPELQQFSIDRDRGYVIPNLKLALAKNPQLLFFASPWSPPGWMKSSGTMVGGHLLPKHYASYASYFVKFIQAYEHEGIPIHAVTVQNEPGVDREHDAPKWRYPSCHWTAEQERTFIREHLGPALQKSGLKTRIWCYDHNYNVAPTPDGDDPGIAYPRLILSDPEAARFVAGVAFHGYTGKPEGMSTFQREYPDRPLHFTEGSVFGLAGAQKLIALLTNGASSYNAWVTIIDDAGTPNNGPFRASRTCVTLDPKRLAVDYRLDYFLYGQFMKYIERDAVRIDVSSKGEDLPAVGFRNPDGKIVLIVVNPRDKQRSMEILFGGFQANYIFDARSVTTLTWMPTSE